MKLLKNIIFQADDFGYSDCTDYLLQKLKKRKKIINFSVLPNFFSKKNKKHYLIKKQKLAAHINLVEGKPISPKNKIRSLVDKKGNFYPLFIFIIRVFLKKIKIKEIYLETEAQINFLKKKGAIIVELNSHQHIHALSPIADIFFALAKKNNIEFIRSYHNVYSQTFIAKIKHLGLKMLAYLSELIYNKKLRLPKSWIIDDKTKIIFMSWEDRKFQFSNLEKYEKFKIIIHPGLPFDNNQDYIKMLI